MAKEKNETFEEKKLNHDKNEFVNIKSLEISQKYLKNANKAQDYYTIDLSGDRDTFFGK